MATAASLLYTCPEGDYNPGTNPNIGRDDNQSNGTCVKLAGCETDPVSEITNTVKNFLKDAKKVPIKTPKTTNFPNDLTILKSTRLFFL